MSARSTVRHDPGSGTLALNPKKWAPRPKISSRSRPSTSPEVYASTGSCMIAGARWVVWRSMRSSICLANSINARRSIVLLAFGPG